MCSLVANNPAFLHADSEDSDQTGHLPSLIRGLTVCSLVAKDPAFLHADSEDSDQTGQIPC